MLIIRRFATGKQIARNGDHYMSHPHPPSAAPASDLLYGLNDRPPFFQALLAGLQHVLSGFVSIIAPPLIICETLHLPFDMTNYVVSMACIISGAAIYIQARRFGPIGSGLLSIQGTSFSFLGPLCVAGDAAIRSGLTPLTALSMLLLICFSGSFLEMLLSRFLQFCRRIFTPLVTGIVVILIGTTLIQVAVNDMGGGFAAQADGSFGALRHLGLSGLVLAVILACNMCRNAYLRMSSIVLGVLAGYATAIAMGAVDFSPVQELGWFSLPVPFKLWSLEGARQMNWGAFIPVAIIYVFTLIESIGDLTATSMVSNEPVSGPTYIDRIRAGTLGDGFNSMLAAVFGTFPNTTFSQNNGIIQLTGVASRRVGYYAAAILVLLGLFPFIGGFLQCMPKPVLGGATFVMFGSVAVAGIKIAVQRPIDRRGLLIMSMSLGLGLGVTFVPEITQHLPRTVQNVFSSGISTGGICAIALNLLLPGRPAA